MKHNWIACWLTPDLEGWHCSECGEEFIEPEGLGLECFGYMGVERDMNKILNNKNFSFREWFDNFFHLRGLLVIVHFTHLLILIKSLNFVSMKSSLLGKEYFVDGTIGLFGLLIFILLKKFLYG